VIRDDEDLREVFGGDPYPMKRKRLTIRYQHFKFVGCIRILDNSVGIIPKQLLLVVPPFSTFIHFTAATYGHPKGVVEGRGAYDVVEILNGRLDLYDDNLLEIRSDENLCALFDDPSIGMTIHIFLIDFGWLTGRRKVLKIDYVIDGRQGELEEEEVSGLLLNPVAIHPTPIISPLILIEQATYGVTHFTKQEKMNEIERELFKLSSIHHKKRSGLPVKKEELAKLWKVEGLKKWYDYWDTAPEESVDITGRVQQMVEETGGQMLEINPETIDLEAEFGSPLPGQHKVLHIEYSIIGHDSEMLTSSEEVTENGYPKNFIRQKKGLELVTVLEDEEHSIPTLQEHIQITAPRCLALIECDKAVYGHRFDTRRVYDVTAQVNGRILRSGGHQFFIDDCEELNMIFGDPCPGVRKKLWVKYCTRGFAGSMRVENINDYPQSTIQLGYRLREEDLEP